MASLVIELFPIEPLDRYCVLAFLLALV